ncbi:MAG: NTP transferase domain-containing protein [Eubacteriales bacterium]
MRALILNSGMGKRMGDITDNHPKCMTYISKDETILSRQLKKLCQCGIDKVIMTTGYFDKVLVNYCKELKININYSFIKNDIYYKTNYIYSIYLAREYLNDDIILMHGDLVFEIDILKKMLDYNKSCMSISTTNPLPKKDFKAVIKDNKIKKIGIEFFENAVTAQPLYKINRLDWKVWLDEIIFYCENKKVSCYAENAFNKVSEECDIYPLDFNNKICIEIDTPEDLELVKNKL